MIESDVRRQIASVLSVHYPNLSLCAIEDLDEIVRDAVRARELQIAQMAEDTGTNELIRFASILRGESHER